MDFTGNRLSKRHFGADGNLYSGVRVSISAHGVHKALDCVGIFRPVPHYNCE
jgi:hypothetical protein